MTDGCFGTCERLQQAGQVHRVRYHEDTEFVICSDGIFDVFWDEEWPADDAKT